MSSDQYSESSENRHPPTERPYKCSCGQSFYTLSKFEDHHKSAHIQHPPSHDLASNDVEITPIMKARRGRPRKEFSSKYCKFYHEINQYDLIDPIPRLIELLQDYRLPKNRSLQDIYFNEDIYNLIREENINNFKPEFSKVDKIYNVNIAEGIQLFWQELSERLQNKNVYDEIVILLLLLTGYVIEEVEDRQVIRVGTVGFIAEFVNFFVTNKMSSEATKMEVADLWIFQDYHYIDVLNAFFQWTVFKKFSLTRAIVQESFYSEGHKPQSKRKQERYLKIEYKEKQAQKATINPKLEIFKEDKIQQPQVSKRSHPQRQEEFKLAMQMPRKMIRKLVNMDEAVDSKDQSSSII